MQKYGKNEQVIEIRNGYVVAQQNLNNNGAVQFWVHDVNADTFTFFWTLKDARAHVDSQTRHGGQMTDEELTMATDDVWLNSVRTDANDARDAQEEFEARTAELTNEAVQLASDESVIEEAWHLIEIGADYSIQPRFFENSDIGMYTYQPDMVDGEWPTPEVWLVDQRTSGCDMDRAVKLVRVI